MIQQFIIFFWIKKCNICNKRLLQGWKQLSCKKTKWEYRCDKDHMK